MQSNSICALAWRNINTTPQGQCKLCCNISDNIVIRNDDATPVKWNTQSLDEIWNGRYMQSIRQQMLAGNVVDDCRVCNSIEQSGNPSPRTHANKEYADTLTSELHGVAASMPDSLELRLSTVCNLQCVTCWSGSSSKVAEERAHAIKHTALPQWLEEDWRNETATYYADTGYINAAQSKDNFRRIAPTLKRLYITGGEPTMDANIYQYLDILLDAGNINCHISFTTNCTVWNYKLLDRLAKFNNTEVQISIDGLTQVDEYIRYPTVWGEKVRNFEKYLRHDVAKTLKIYTVVSALNYNSIEPLIQWLIYMAEDHSKNIIWYPIILDFPHYLSAKVIPLEHRKQQCTSCALHYDL
jgi:sulfatase maturation enzyme AslB (radical SAM superfamily)